MNDDQLERAFGHWEAANDFTHSSLRAAEQSIREALRTAYISGFKSGWREGWQSHDTKKALVDSIRAA